MNKTNIEWVKNPDGTQGYTWNPITGCLNHTPEGLCLGGMFPCYAYKLANGRLRQRYLANHHLANGETLTNLEAVRALKDPFYPRFWEERLQDVIRGYHYSSFSGSQSEFAAKPRGIFVCDMGELFGDWIPKEWQAKVFRAINDWDNRHDRFYLLTKQPQNLAKWSPFPGGSRVGVTACTPQMLTNALYGLMQIETKVKYISFEPLLEWQKIKKISALAESFQIAGINWLIIGAQTKPYKPPKIEGVEEIVRAADQAGIPVFLKNNIRPLIREAVWPQWSMDKRGDLRQEMPGARRD